ncbi:general transcription factor II-I repeat domain-containing protein 2B-like [Rhopalosiphum padi]|uniref:general transcription factor II-I repeat domain-containing protein 2B-like n=1 Tax=Rhopalosiphum padi TaxID=40932 RepID=UPI00298DA59B|nr:general transcription factor II-I repeat domain-containing protein 2B-like [Rhopalosiphum padi]XP_060838966.1 general transcription factor II-I repeat domain-containing protein 2B-like [Rhopalosiphum padi]XP_060848262.1 general transcription factor II-I repeat domain-containing protein 2B-like [Rhopalosiphum padi]XP_060848284.1 general transcription factor II-I repeat domain-containing protein 2B-like [Rhopalosiphum padi]XP_060852880.1 general transcription factor II-I repeat domain-containi
MSGRGLKRKIDSECRVFNEKWSLDYFVIYSEYNLKWENLKCITTDGGRNMCGTKKGLIGQIFTNCEKEGFQPMTLHCIIHQQALCGKTLDLSCVMDPIISTVNFIRSSALRHRQFQDFLKEIETEYPDIPYFTAVRWLSRGKVLSRFFELRNEIEIFLIDKNRPLPLLTDSEWVWKLAFLVDITKYMNDFNLKLQGKDVLICDVYTLVKAFRQKLILFETQISKNCFIHFSTCDKYNKESRTQFPVDFAQKIISELKIQFKQRFSDLDVKSEEINIFQNPFSCDIEKLPPTLQMEMIDLQSNDALKIKHREETLVDFYKFLPDIQYPNLKKFAIEYISVFATTYLCEQTFSKMKYIKSKYRSAMTDKHLESILKIGTSNIQPQFDRILAEKHQFHTSH